MRSLAPVAAVGSSAVIIGAVVLFLWVLGSSVVQREQFSTLDMAPRDVDFYLAINTEPASSQWIAFANLLGAINVEDTIRNAWLELLLEQDVRWDKDVVSLLGDEAYLAITDYSALEDGHGLVAAIQLRDAGKAEELFLRLASDAAEDAGEEFLEDTYEGETIYYLEQGSGDSFFGLDDEFFFDETAEIRDSWAISFVGDVAVAGLAREDVQGVIDVLQGRAPTIADNQRFQELRALQEDDFLLWAYADLAPLWDFVEENFTESNDDAADVENILEEARPNADRSSLTVSAFGDGFVIDSIVLRAPDAPADTNDIVNTVFETHYAERVPEDTLAFIAGYDLYNGIYLPLYDAIAEIDTSFTDPYCGELSGFQLLPTAYDERDDPVIGRFYDEDGNYDFAAAQIWFEELDRRFTEPDGGFDGEGYTEYIENLYAEACEGRGQTIDEELQEFERDVGFDLEDDLLSFMTGEFALALNASNFYGEQPYIDIVGMLDITNAAAVSESMKLLERYLEREEGWFADTDDAGIHRLSNNRGSDDIFAWAVTGDSLAVGYPDGPIEAFVHGLDGKSLAESADWKRMMALLPEDKSFVAYVSVARLLEEVRDAEGLAEELEDATNGEVTLEDLEAIRSLGIATTPIEGGWKLRIAVLVKD